MTEQEKQELKELFSNIVDSQLRPIKADILQLADENRRLKGLLSTGKGLLKNNDEIDPSEYKQLAKARIEAASLEEIALMTAAEAGIDVTNENEYRAYVDREAEKRRNE